MYGTLEDFSSCGRNDNRAIGTFCETVTLGIHVFLPAITKKSRVGVKPTRLFFVIAGSPDHQENRVKVSVCDCL